MCMSTNLTAIQQRSDIVHLYTFFFGKHHSLLTSDSGWHLWHFIVVLVNKSKYNIWYIEKKYIHVFVCAFCGKNYAPYYLIGDCLAKYTLIFRHTHIFLYIICVCIYTQSTKYAECQCTRLSGQHCFNSSNLNDK